MRRFLCALLVALALPPASAQEVLRLFNWNNYITESSVKTFERQMAAFVEAEPVAS